jgi:metal-responsive CopG/Arc/MetJ family transcriptional regulator
MNVNIYLEDSLAESLAKEAESLGESRNSLIRLAIREWLAQKRTKQWPHLIRTFKGISSFPAFEDYRSELTPPKEDPFA